jgi:hypothetical protein
MRKITVVCIMMSLGGCASFSGKPETVILQNPQTMEFVNCDVSKWETEESYRANDQCVKDYEARGFVVWGKR